MKFRPDPNLFGRLLIGAGFALVATVWLAIVFAVLFIFAGFVAYVLDPLMHALVSAIFPH